MGWDVTFVSGREITRLLCFMQSSVWLNCERRNGKALWIPAGFERGGWTELSFRKYCLYSCFVTAWWNNPSSREGRAALWLQWVWQRLIPVKCLIKHWLGCWITQPTVFPVPPAFGHTMPWLYCFAIWILVWLQLRVCVCADCAWLISFLLALLYQLWGRNK